MYCKDNLLIFYKMLNYPREFAEKQIQIGWYIWLLAAILSRFSHKKDVLHLPLVLYKSAFCNLFINTRI